MFYKKHILDKIRSPKMSLKIILDEFKADKLDGVFS